MSNNLQCPVDFVAINENKARVNAFFVFGLALTYLLTGFWPIFMLLTLDFLLRASSLANYSAIGFLSDAVIRQLNIGNKLVDRAPKRFAAWVGFGFSVAIVASALLQWTLAANALTGTIVVFAFLESFAGFCAGCYVYTFGLLLIGKKER